MTQTIDQPTLAVAESRQAFSSVEITKNSRGYTYSVKVYCGIGEELAALDKAREVEALLRQEYGDAAE